MTAFEKHFPDWQNDDKLKLINEEELKTPEGKKRWREFMLPFEKKIGAFSLSISSLVLFPKGRQ